MFFSLLWVPCIQEDPCYIIDVERKGVPLVRQKVLCLISCTENEKQER